MEVLAHARFAQTVLSRPPLPGVDTYIVVAADGRALTDDALKRLEAEHQVVGVRNPHADLDPLVKQILAKDYVGGGVFAHGLSQKQAMICNYLLSRVPARAFYFCYGGELYSRLSAIGKLALYDNSHWWPRIYDLIILMRTSLSTSRGLKSPVLGEPIINFMNRLSFINTLFPSDANLWSELVAKDLRRLPYVYPISEYALNLSVKEDKDLVFINHSASRTGNHEFVLNYLAEHKLPDLKLILPMSYGNPRYLRRIKSLLAKSVHHDAIVLQNSLPYDSYVDMCAGAVCAIYGHRRQEAVGNIFIMLYIGARVYLRQQNPLLQDLRQLGLIVFCLEEDFPVFKLDPIAPSHIEQNRQKVRMYASPEAWLKYYEAIVSAM